MIKSLNKLLAVALLFITISEYCSARNKSTVRDSLLQILNISESPLEKYNTYVKLIPTCSVKEQTNALSYKNQAMILSELLEDDSLYLNAIYQFSRWNEKLFLYDQSIESSILLKENAKQKNHLFFLAKSHESLGFSYKAKADFEKSTYHYNECIVLLEKSPFVDFFINCKIQSAGLKRITGEIEEAERICLEVLENAEQRSKYENLRLLYNILGRINRGQGKYDKAKYYYELGVKTAIQNNDVAAAGVGYNNLGNIAQTRAEFSGAIEYYTESLKLRENTNDKKGIAICYVNIGTVYLDINQLQKAEENILRGIEIAKQIQYNIFLPFAYSKLSNIALERKDYDKSLAWVEKSLELSMQNNHYKGKVTAYITMADVYKAKGDYKNTFKYCIKALKLAEEKEFKKEISSCLVILGESIQKIESSQNPIDQIELYNMTGLQSDEIESLLIKSKNIAFEIKNFENIVNSLLALKLYYKNIGDLKNQLFITDTYMLYRDSLFNQNRSEALAESETKFKTAEKEKEILVLQKENELQAISAKYARNNFIGIGLLLLLVGSTWIYHLYSQNKIKREKQINTLRTKISSDLHDDVGSILTGLSMQSEILEYRSTGDEKEKAKEIGNLAKSAMSRMRDAVWAMDARKDNWESLLIRMFEFGQEHIVSNNIQFELKHENIDLAKNIESEIRQNLYLIFKEALTNVLKHSNADRVIINISNRLDGFSMEILDNGRFEEKEYKTSGLGTDNMKMRADQIQADLSFIKENGFAVILKRASIRS